MTRRAYTPKCFETVELQERRERKNAKTREARTANKAKASAGAAASAAADAALLGVYQTRAAERNALAEKMVGAYVLTLSDARAWAETTDKFIFAQDLLDVSLLEDGDEYVGRMVARVESAFENLLSEDSAVADAGND